SCLPGQEVCGDNACQYVGFCKRDVWRACGMDDFSTYPERDIAGGFAVTAEALASHGYVAILINANDLCYGRAENIAERLLLFREHMAYWFGGFTGPFGLSSDRLDPSAVTL